MLNELNFDRIERLRLSALNYTSQYSEFYAAFYDYVLSHKEKTLIENYADAYRHAFTLLTPVIDTDELIVGKCKNFLTEEEAALWRSVEAEARALFPMVGQDSHMSVDYDLILTRGLTGIIEDIRAKLSMTRDAEKIAFYNNCIACLESVCAFSERYAAHAAALAHTEEDEVRRAELLNIADICARVPKYPAQSFYEAVQSAHFVTFCLSINPMRLCWQQFQLGHPDRYLYPYYEKDLASGIITRAEAQLLLDCLGVQINNRVPHGLSCGYMVGGRNRNGEIVANELTEMLMQVVDDIRLVYPSVGLCYTEGQPDRYLRTACEILSHGRSHPAIFNDDIISEGLRYYGLSDEESHDYIHSTCVEITPAAASNVWVASPYISLVEPLLALMDREYTCMDELLTAVFDRLDATIKAKFEQQNELRRLRSTQTINPLLSCFVNDCLARGVDIEQGGARYNWIMPSFVGMSNLADSLTTIEQLVFEQKKMTVAQIKALTDRNFEGCEDVRQEILCGLPKYGNDDETADKWCSILTEHIVAECKKYTPILSGAKLIPSVFCWIMHQRIGDITGATPDGRIAGFPLGDGSGPAQGRERKGPTASVLSSTKWSHKEFIGGVAVNMKFSKKVFVNDSFATMMALIKTYMQRGGFEMQINVVDRDILLEAKVHPEQYRDLVVRIGGYSDYFVTLSPSMQEEVLLRTTHEI